MKRSKLNELQARHCIFDCELESVLEFVSDVLDAEADYLEDAEPYATKTIQKLRSAAYEVFDLLRCIEEDNAE